MDIAIPAPTYPGVALGCFQGLPSAARSDSISVEMPTGLSNVGTYGHRLLPGYPVLNTSSSLLPALRPVKVPLWRLVLTLAPSLSPRALILGFSDSSPPPRPLTVLVLQSGPALPWSSPSQLSLRQAPEPWTGGGDWPLFCDTWCSVPNPIQPKACQGCFYSLWPIGKCAFLDKGHLCSIPEYPQG